MTHVTDEPGMTPDDGPCGDADDLPAALVGNDMARDLGWIVGQIQHGYLAAASCAVTSVPGGLRGLHVLSAAICGHAPNQIEVARRFGIDRTVMVRLIDDMERAGLVERRPDPADRRARMIVGTDLGRVAHDQAQARLRQVEDEVLGPLSDDERVAFLAMARRVVAHLITEDPGQVESACEAANATLDRHTPLASGAGR